MLSLRCLISLSSVATMAASSSSMRSSTSRCLMAACNRRMVPRRWLSLARMAAFTSSVMRLLRFMVFLCGWEALEHKNPAPGVPGAGWAAAPDRARLPCGVVRGRAAAAQRESVQLLGQLHAAHALVVALDGGRLLALPFGGGLLVELAGAQVGQQAQFFDGALEAAQRHVKGFVLFYTDGRHQLV